MTIDGLSEALAGNETIAGFDSVDSLAQAHIDLATEHAKPWTESFSDDFKTEENLKALEGIETPEALAKSHIELKASMPKFEVPEKPEDYEIPETEGVKVDEELQGQFKGWAHEAKLNKDQAAFIAGKWNSVVAKAVKDQAEAETKQHDDAVNALKDTWKGDYEKNLEGANLTLGRAAKVAGMTDEELKQVSDRYGDDPLLNRIFHAISTKTSEDTFEAGSGNPPPKEEVSGEDFIKGVFKKGE